MLAVVLSDNFVTSPGWCTSTATIRVGIGIRAEVEVEQRRPARNTIGIARRNNIDDIDEA